MSKDERTPNGRETHQYCLLTEEETLFHSAKVLRHGVMAFFFLFLLHVAYDHQVKGGGPRGTPSVEAYCPFGGLENLYQSDNGRVREAY